MPAFAIVIAVPFGVAVVITVLGGIAWLVEQPKRLRARQEKRQAKTQLAAELQNPQAPASLPYGYSNAPTSSDADQRQ